MRGFRWPPPPDGGPRTWGPGPGAPRTGRPALPEPETELVATPHGVSLERLVTGTGDPVTVFAHGLGSGIATTRPFGSGVTGRRVFFQFRGHGRSDSPPGPWSYLDLARDLRAMADLSGATRAFGASLGAGALCRLLAESPERFEKLVFFLPAVLDTPRGEAARARLTGLLDAVAEGDASALADAVSLELPPSVRNTPAGWAYLRQRLDQLLRDGLAPGLADLPAQAPLDDAGSLAAVTAPALVIAAAEDDLHPVAVAERLAAALPNATLHVYDRPGVLWTERADLRERVSEFLNG
ncbi:MULTISPECIES: alpha/beta fold hydrolase [Micromonospora]|uniref:alpha/beta fold hydrolase n=1 Tax=Micromonospora TaxID=1873 RepID=UPI0001C46623|nr:MULTISPECIES: alpha/beta hydrolase [unclassified Micromonospora]ADU08316.1 alpha/beta hydrolase fold protein [Micromonospora sp. L5]MCO1613865.1 alpha/beta hydrolase [Micromonospora sp. CPM1]RLQ08928.1 alpha/beta hydrolase [Micromonospora sp. BL1]